MKLEATKIPGCWKITPPIFRDERGSFVKTFNNVLAAEHGLSTSFAEEFYSWSKRGVLRGLHFQVPPADHTKVVSCLYGEVLDVVVDLRIGSPTFGCHDFFPLRATDATLIYIPPGLAHGFLTISNETLMYYQVTSIHNPECDSGIRWDSAGIPWPQMNPLISQRDANLPCFKDFVSPYYYCEAVNNEQST